MTYERAELKMKILNTLANSLQRQWDTHLIIACLLEIGFRTVEIASAYLVEEE